MDIETNSKCIVGIFFLYLVMFGSGITSLLNCNLQKFMYSNVYFKHVIVFFSILMFTFILNWYTPSSLVLIESFDEKEYQNRYKYVLNSFYYSLLIYGIFLLSTKQTPFFMGLFLFFIFAIIVLFIFYKIELTSLNITDYVNKNIINVEDVQRWFKNNNNNNDNVPNDFFNNTVLFHNTLFIMFVIVLLNLLLGTYFYYKKQVIDHKRNWSWVSFIFGTNNCDHLK